MHKLKLDIIHALQSEKLSENKLVEISDICDNYEEQTEEKEICKSFKSLYYQIEDMANCEECSNEDKVDSIKLIISECLKSNENVL